MCVYVSILRCALKVRLQGRILNLTLILQEVHRVLLLCAEELVLAIKEGPSASWPVCTARGWVTSVEPDKLWQNTCGFPTSAHTASHIKSCPYQLYCDIDILLIWAHTLDSFHIHTSALVHTHTAHTYWHTNRRMWETCSHWALNTLKNTCGDVILLWVLQSCCVCILVEVLFWPQEVPESQYTHTHTHTWTLYSHKHVHAFSHTYTCQTRRMLLSLWKKKMP